MMKNRQGIRALMATIDRNESHCDHIERSLMIKVFDSDLDKVDQLQLKEVITIAAAVTVTLMTVFGLPVSISQAVVGVGLVRGANTIKRKTLYGIFTGWFLTPPVACFIAMCTDFTLHLRYVPH